MQIKWRLKDKVITMLVLKLYLLTFCQHLGISLNQKLLFQFKVIKLFDFLLYQLLRFIKKFTWLLFSHAVSFIFDIGLPSFTVVLQRSSTTKTLKIVFMLNDGIYILWAIIGHIGDSPGLFLIFILEFVYFLLFLDHDTSEKFMLIVGLIKLVILIHFGNELLKIFDFLSIFHRLSSYLSQLHVQIVIFQLFLGE